MVTALTHGVRARDERFGRVAFQAAALEPGAARLFILVREQDET